MRHPQDSQNDLKKLRSRSAHCWSSHRHMPPANRHFLRSDLTSRYCATRTSLSELKAQLSRQYETICACLTSLKLINRCSGCCLVSRLADLGVHEDNVFRAIESVHSDCFSRTESLQQHRNYHPGLSDCLSHRRIAVFRVVKVLDYAELFR
jgi:hypothetical protein